MLDEMGEKTSPTDRLAYFHQFEQEYSASIDFEQYVDVSHSRLHTVPVPVL